MSLSGVAHSLAMVSTLLLVLGAFGLTQSIATAVSGFIVPSIMERMAQDAADAAHQWRIVTFSIFQINQAFSRIYSVAASIAIILWSVSALRNGGFARGIAVYGNIISPLIILGIVVGHLRMDVHGMAAVVLGQAIWFILVGSQLWSRSGA